MTSIRNIAFKSEGERIVSDNDRSSGFLGRPGSQHRPKLKSQLVSQIIDARSDGNEEASLLHLAWVEVRDNVIPPHAVPFASDGHGPLFIARAHLEGTFCDPVGCTPVPRTAELGDDMAFRQTSLYVDIWKAHDTLVPLKSSLELKERSRSLPPRARTSSFDARAELGTFRCDSAQSAGVTVVIASATHRPEYAPASRPSVVASSKPQIRLDCASQESYKLPTVVGAVEYSVSERGTPVSSF
ncbi:hypothetical protein BDR03DRAFT_1075150, partial [Suillus americanus]